MKRSWVTIDTLREINLDGVEAVAADVDHTLFDFDRAHRAGVDAVRKEIDARLGELLSSTFDLVLEGSRRIDRATWERRAEFEELLCDISAAQGVTRREAKRWSRETWMQVISDRERMGLTVPDIVQARDAYWRTLSVSGGVYRDVGTLLGRMREREIPLVLMTASDSVLRPEGNHFAYDPEYAASYKRERLERMRIPHAGVVIGDPHDKPSPEFFDMVDEAVYAAGAANVGRAVAVGDSPRGDVQIPAQRGYRAYHIRRK